MQKQHYIDLILKERNVGFLLFEKEIFRLSYSKDDKDRETAVFYCMTNSFPDFKYFIFDLANDKNDFIRSIAIVALAEAYKDEICSINYFFIEKALTDPSDDVRSSALVEIENCGNPSEEWVILKYISQSDESDAVKATALMRMSFIQMGAFE